MALGTAAVRRAGACRLLSGRTIAVVALGVGLASQPALANREPLRGHSDHCELPELALACAGYIAAIANLIAVIEIDGWRVCIPTSTTRMQVRDLVIDYIADHRPDQLSSGDLGNTTGPAAAAALSQAFPCADFK